MTIYYVTNGAWRSGTGSALAPAQVDGNFYDVDQRIVTLNTSLAQGKRIDHVTYTNTDMTFHYTDSTTQTIPLPVATLRYVGPWMPTTPYSRGDLFTEGSGFYQVLENHTSGSTFNPNATDGTTANNPLYSLWMPLFDTLDSLNDVVISAAANGQVLAFNGTSWVNQTAGGINLDALTDVVITSASNGQALIFNGTNWVNQVIPAPSLTLDNLTDATITTPAAGQALSYDGSQWINRSAVDLPALNTGSVSGSITFNFQTNEFVRIQLTGNITIIGFSWPTSSSGRMVRRIVEIKGSGSFTVTWPPIVKWAGGTIPVLTTGGGTDVYVIYTYDGGATIFGNVIGQAYA